MIADTEYRSPDMRRHEYGYTVTELLVVIAIISVLGTAGLVALISVRESAQEARAKLELRSIENAAMLYYETHDTYPADADRDLPSGLESYLSSGSWPNAPWHSSVYDWDNWDSGDLAHGPQQKTLQISVRFCDIGGSNCTFPDEAWAEHFDANSSYFYCLEGPCRSHSNEPVTHPGYCAGGDCPDYDSYACDPECHAKP